MKVSAQRVKKENMERRKLLRSALFALQVSTMMTLQVVSHHVRFAALVDLTTQMEAVNLSPCAKSVLKENIMRMKDQFHAFFVL